MYDNLKDLQEALLKGETTIEEEVEGYLQRMEANSHLNIYVEIWKEEVLDQAAVLDRKIREEPGKLGKLFGLVVSIKDVICYKDHGVSAGSRILEGFKSIYSATAVERLLAEDALIIGRTNCDEFAMGSTNETSYYGPSKNAADPGRSPGGSSGGAAVAVQADTCMLSLGSDTGGSVRQPAAFCGVIGFKPTYGRISRHGLLAYGSSFDQIGLIARDIATISTCLEVIAGPDEYDSTAIPEPFRFSQKPGAGKTTCKIAFLRPALAKEGLQPEVRKATEQALSKLEAAGHSVEGVDFKLLDYMIPAYYVLTTAEASSNLSRYDGIRYGYRSKEAENLFETYTRSRSEGFGREVKRRIMLGAFVLSAGYYDAYYGQAQKVRRLIREQTEAIFKEYDFVIMPSSPTTALPLGGNLEDPVSMYLADIFTVQANLCGIPAVSLPISKDKAGLPIGIQLMAPAGKEADLLRFAEECFVNTF